MGEADARCRAKCRVVDRQSRTRAGRGRPRGRFGYGRRGRIRLRRARHHDRHVSQRPDTHRAGAAPRRTRGRAAFLRSRNLAEVVRLPMGTAENGHTAAPRSRQHRLRSPRRTRRIHPGTRRRSAGAIFVLDRAHRAAADCVLSPPYKRSGSRFGARQPRSFSAVQRPDPRHRPALLSVARR